MTRLASLVLVVRNLERALVIYEQALGFTRVDEPCEVPNMGARHVFLRAENCLLELVQPNNEKSPPGLFMRQRGEGMFAMKPWLDFRNSQHAWRHKVGTGAWAVIVMTERRLR